MLFILFFIFSAISPPLYRYLVLDAHLRGLPFPFVLVGDSCKGVMSECAQFFGVNFAVDLIFWYLVANLFDYLDEQIKKG